MFKERLKQITIIRKGYNLYNMIKNLFFLRNNLLFCYIKSIINKNRIDISWNTKLYDCKFDIGHGGGNNKRWM